MRDAFGDSHKMLGEESVLPGMNASMQALESMLALNDAEYLWIVDPIDGTWVAQHL
jgi:myo-inositol-1(or 4)-monophosphatase